MAHANTLSWKGENVYLKEAFVILLAGLCITLMGQFSIPLPFTPVPLSFRMQTIFLLSVLIGSRKTLMATLFFLFQGCMGLPVFASGASGVAGLLGPSGGYYAGFVLAILSIGYITEKYKASASFSFLLGTLVVYCAGCLYLSFFLGMEKAFLLGVVPFLIGDFLKTVLCLQILRWVKR